MLEAISLRRGWMRCSISILNRASSIACWIDSYACSAPPETIVNMNSFPSEDCGVCCCCCCCMILIPWFTRPLNFSTDISLRSNVKWCLMLRNDKDPVVSLTERRLSPSSFSCSYESCFNLRTPASPTDVMVCLL